MSDVIKVKIGEALTREEWLSARDELAKILDMVGNLLASNSKSSTDEQALEGLLGLTALAYSAMTYVAEFATEICRIIVVEDRKK